MVNVDAFCGRVSLMGLVGDRAGQVQTDAPGIGPRPGLTIGREVEDHIGIGFIFRPDRQARAVGIAGLREIHPIGVGGGAIAASVELR